MAKMKIANWPPL